MKNEFTLTADELVALETRWYEYHQMIGVLRESGMADDEIKGEFLKGGADEVIVDKLLRGAYPFDDVQPS